MGAGENSGPHASQACPLLSEPSPQPHEFGYFPDICLLLISNIALWWSEGKTCMISTVMCVCVSNWPRSWNMVNDPCVQYILFIK